VLDGGEALKASLNEATMTGHAATLEDVGAVAAFVASDKARTMTAATVNVSAGARPTERRLVRELVSRVPRGVPINRTEERHGS
jgi:enoyl-[acyl-carrier-protein] reductase (NADH)